MYEITSAPKEYTQFTGTDVYKRKHDTEDDAIDNHFLKPSEKEIIEFLNKGDFTCMEKDDTEYIVLPSSIITTNENTELTKAQKEYIWNSLETMYIGFPLLKEKGFKKREFNKIKTIGDMERVLNKYIEDAHFAIMIYDYTYQMPTVHDEGCEKSIDPPETYFEVETSNALYARFSNCTGPEYFEGVNSLGLKAKDKDFLILDARSNSGGDDGPQWNVEKDLKRFGFTGTVVVIQDNYSFSSGEVWHVFGQTFVPYKCVLVGTHSGGAQVFANGFVYKNDDASVYMVMGAGDFRKVLPSNYLGDGKGFEPEIWATTPQLKQTLEEMGIDTGDIVFQ